MKKLVLFILVLTFGIYLFGCGKKQQALEQMQEPMSIETLSTLGTPTQPTPETKIPGSKAQADIAASSSEPKLETLPLQMPYKPTTEEIQRALKNAGYYTGVIDGKKGPMTKKAIEDFQKANGLEVDGKVGPKTWAVLSKNLEPQTSPPVSAKKR